MNTVIIAIVMGIMYWWCRGMILSYFGFLFISSPVTVGLVAGLLMGQPMQGLIIGGGIALVFAGIFAPGANLPTAIFVPGFGSYPPWMIALFAFVVPTETSFSFSTITAFTLYFPSS